MSTKHPDVTQRHKGKEEPGLGEQRQAQTTLMNKKENETQRRN